MSLGSKLKSLRKDRGMSLQKVADAINSSKSHLYEIEEGRSNPTFAKVVLLANFFGVQLNFFSEDDKEAESCTEQYYRNLAERKACKELLKFYDIQVEEFALMRDLPAVLKFDEALWRIADTQYISRERYKKLIGTTP